MRSDEWPAWFSFWFSGCWRALAKGTAWAGFYCVIPVSYTTSDAADEEDSVDLGGRRIIKKKKKNYFSLSVLLVVL